MKIRQKKNNKGKLFKLKLIKAKVYDKKYVLHFLKIENIEHRLKKVFQIIHKYHNCNKKILFVGFSFAKKIKRLLQNTSHKFLASADFNFVKTIKNKLQTNINKYGLVVVLKPLLSDSVIKESHKLRIPSIFLSTRQNFTNATSNYNLSGHFSFRKKILKNFFFFGLLKIVLQKKRKKRVWR